MTTLTLAPDPDDRDSQVAEIVAAIHRLDAERARIDEQRALYAGRLLDLLPDGTTPVGDSKVIVTRPRRFNPAAFEARFSPDKCPMAYTTTLDQRKAKAFLEFANVDDADVFFTTGKRQVTVK